MVGIIQNLSRYISVKKLCIHMRTLATFLISSHSVIQ